MAKKISQEKRVLSRLNLKGKVDNFWAIKNYILRLGAVIHNLKAMGIKTKGAYIPGTKNYQYTLED